MNEWNYDLAAAPEGEAVLVSLLQERPGGDRTNISFGFRLIDGVWLDEDGVDFDPYKVVAWMLKPEPADASKKNLQES